MIYDLHLGLYTLKTHCLAHRQRRNEAKAGEGRGQVKADEVGGEPRVPKFRGGKIIDVLNCTLNRLHIAIKYNIK